MEPLLRQPKDIWDATDFLNKLPSINPRDYFVTSGEAIQKAIKLHGDAKNLVNKAKSFLNELNRAKGKKKYLESSWEDNKLLVKAKNPRRIIDKGQDT